MTTIIVKDWYYENCVNTPIGNWFLDWGYVITTNDTAKTMAVYRTLKGNVIKETDKAICLEVNAMKFNNRCDIIGSMKWRVWMPKKGLVNNKTYAFFDGGESQQVEKWAFNFLHKNPDYKSENTWAFH